MGLSNFLIKTVLNKKLKLIMIERYKYLYLRWDYAILAIENLQLIQQIIMLERRLQALGKISKQYFPIQNTSKDDPVKSIRSYLESDNDFTDIFKQLVMLTVYANEN